MAQMPEERKAKNRAYNAVHREERKVYSATYDVTYYAAHREKRNTQSRAYRSSHREEIKAQRAIYRANNHEKRKRHYAIYCVIHKEEIKSRNIARRTALRREVIAAYGGNKCSCCGETEFKFLCIDHINGGGAKHRKEIGSGGSSLYYWLKKNNYPEGFQVLCHNCNFAKSAYGACPHEATIAEDMEAQHGN